MAAPDFLHPSPTTFGVHRSSNSIYGNIYRTMAPPRAVDTSPFTGPKSTGPTTTASDVQLDLGRRVSGETSLRTDSDRKLGDVTYGNGRDPWLSSVSGASSDNAASSIKSYQLNNWTPLAADSKQQNTTVETAANHKSPGDVARSGSYTQGYERLLSSVAAVPRTLDQITGADEERAATTTTDSGKYSTHLKYLAARPPPAPPYRLSAPAHSDLTHLTSPAVKESARPSSSSTVPPSTDYVAKWQERRLSAAEQKTQPATSAAAMCRSFELYTQPHQPASKDGLSAVNSDITATTLYKPPPVNALPPTPPSVPNPYRSPDSYAPSSPLTVPPSRSTDYTSYMEHAFSSKPPRPASSQPDPPRLACLADKDPDAGAPPRTGLLRSTSDLTLAQRSALSETAASSLNSHIDQLISGYNKSSRTLPTKSILKKRSSYESHSPPYTSIYGSYRPADVPTYRSLMNNKTSTSALPPLERYLSPRPSVGGVGGGRTESGKRVSFNMGYNTSHCYEAAQYDEPYNLNYLY